MRDDNSTEEQLEIQQTNIKEVPKIESEDDNPLLYNNPQTSPENFTDELRKEEQQHKHHKENIIVKRGTWIVVLILGLSFVSAIVSGVFLLFGVEVELFSEIIKLDTTALTLILGYLFGSKSNS